MAILILLAITWSDPRPVVENRPADESTTQRCMPTDEDNWCAPKGDPEVEAVITRLEEGGRECSAAPRLTDIIVFQHKDLSVEIVTFDEAVRLGDSGSGWVQSFCAPK